MRTRISLLVLSLSFTLLSHAQRIGTTPEVVLKTPKDDTAKLSSLAGKVVLVDFWASWCGPCRMANKTLVKLYAKYKDKGFEIYSISCDYTKPSWLKGIKADKLVWTQVWDAEGTVAAKWNIAYIPQTFILDRTGKVVATELAGKKLEEKIKELL